MANTLCVKITGWDFFFFTKGKCHLFAERTTVNLPPIDNTGMANPNHTNYHPLTHCCISLQSASIFVSWKSLRFSNGTVQCDSDFRPFNMRRRITSMPPCELILLIHPWVLLRLMFLGWYSVPLFLVRTCWYCHGGCWNTPEPSACEAIGPHLEIWGCAADLSTVQLLSNLRWDVQVWARFDTGMLLKEHRLLHVNFTAQIRHEM